MAGCELLELQVSFQTPGIRERKKMERLRVHMRAFSHRIKTKTMEEMTRIRRSRNRAGRDWASCSTRARLSVVGDVGLPTGLYVLADRPWATHDGSTPHLPLVLVEARRAHRAGIGSTSGTPGRHAETGPGLYGQ